MVSEGLAQIFTKDSWTVLILVLVEDGLREELSGLSPHKWDSVLILVLVEDGLRGCLPCSGGRTCVLILVLVEDGLRVTRNELERQFPMSLNPCSCGGWSQRFVDIKKMTNKELS